MRVNLGRCETLVTKQFLHTTQVCSTIKQMRSKTMSQSVRRRLLRQAGSQDMFFQHATDTASGQPGAKTIQKECRSLLFRRLL